jgi:hypothetical protein
MEEIGYVTVTSVYNNHLSHYLTGKLLSRKKKIWYFNTMKF